MPYSERTLLFSGVLSRYDGKNGYIFMNQCTNYAVILQNIGIVLDFRKILNTIGRIYLGKAEIPMVPLRTSVSALLSATAACALVLSCGIFSLTGAAGINGAKTAEKPETSYTESFSPETVEDEVSFETEAEEN